MGSSVRQWDFLQHSTPMASFRPHSAPGEWAVGTLPPCSEEGAFQHFWHERRKGRSRRAEEKGGVEACFHDYIRKAHILKTFPLFLTFPPTVRK